MWQLTCTKVEENTWPTCGLHVLYNTKRKAWDIDMSIGIGIIRFASF